MGVWFSKFCAFMSEHRLVATIGFAFVAIAYISNKRARLPSNSRRDTFAESLQHAVKIGKQFYFQVMVY